MRRAIVSELAGRQALGEVRQRKHRANDFRAFLTAKQSPPNDSKMPTLTKNVQSCVYVCLLRVFVFLDLLFFGLPGGSIVVPMVAQIEEPWAFDKNC